MWRDQDPRSYEGGRSRDDVERDDLSRGSRGGSDPREALSRDPRDVFSRGLALPRGSRRQRVTLRERTYELRGSEVRLLATVGAFRAVPQRDLEPTDARTRAGRDREIEHLRNSGLIETRPFGAGRSRTTLVTLTERGRDLLDAAQDRSLDDRQRFYAGFAQAARDHTRRALSSRVRARGREDQRARWPRSARGPRLRAEARVSALPARAQSPEAGQ